MIAIISMAGRFPGAADLDEFWENLVNGRESIEFFDTEALRSEGVPEVDLSDPFYVKAKGALQEIQEWDARFFGVSPGDAQVLDPQHRLFLECAWEALEMAACVPQRYEGSIGVFAGSSLSSYLIQNLSNNPLLGETLDRFEAVLANDKDLLTSRVSYKLGLRGPSVTVQSACSTSLVAVHMACSALLNGECDMALAGAVSITLPRCAGYKYYEGGILSPDGHCRPFDAAAQGTVFGNGCGVVLLKRLEDAVKDRDVVRAVVIGSAVNNDGNDKISFTAPGVSGQAAVIAEALAVANASAQSISYVEAHGTGTSLGDPIEVSALNQAFAEACPGSRKCGIGSVKGNIGHLDVAAGMAGLIKTVLCLERQQLVPSINFLSPNSAIQFCDGPFRVVDRLTPWSSEGQPRRAGVSSFGIGGTNAHAVLEEAPVQSRSGTEHRYELLVFSAQTPEAADASVSRFKGYLERTPAANISDVAYTLALGRAAFTERRVAVAKDRKDALSQLESGVFGGSANALSAVFMFPGGGSQYHGMSAGLRHELVFKQSIEYCATVLKDGADVDILSSMLSGEPKEPSKPDLDVALSLLFSVEYALARLLISMGLEPTAMVGHSLGEYVAACLAGVISLENALTIVALRGRLMNHMAAGSMLSVNLPEYKILELAPPNVTIAAVNAPELCVVSGLNDVISAFKKSLEDLGIESRSLRISVAAHSPLVEPVLEEFRRFASTLELKVPNIPFLSNVTGTWIKPEEATDPNYWVRHLREPVQFSACIRELIKDPANVFIEVGPGQALSVLARQQETNSIPIAVTTLGRAEQDPSRTEDLLRIIGQLWTKGLNVDWKRYYSGQKRRRLALPTYPFQRSRHWVDPSSAKETGLRTSLKKRHDITDWFYTRSWEKTLPYCLRPQRPSQELARPWLVLSDDKGLCNAVCGKLREQGIEVFSVKAASERQHVGQLGIRPGDRQDMDWLIQWLKEQRRLPGTILHAWGLVDGVHDTSSLLERSFHSVLQLCQALGAAGAQDVDVAVVTECTQIVVDGDEVLSPELAASAGPVRVAPREYPGVRCRQIDVSRSLAPSRFAEQIIEELQCLSGASLGAFRGYNSFVETFKQAAIGPVAGDTGLRRGGTYLITGGLGGIGLTLAQHFAQSVNANLVLTSRRALPPRSHWDAISAEGKSSEAKILAKLLELQCLGSEILVIDADATNAEDMIRVLKELKGRFGILHGIVHAAGIPGGGMIQLKSRAQADSVLDPKVRGLNILKTLLSQTEKPDFVVLCSSLSAVLGEFGQVDYCAANACLDAGADWLRSQCGVRAHSIAWDAWSQVGMATLTDVPPELQAWRKATLQKGMTNAEGLDVFARMLSVPKVPSVLVATQDLHLVLNEIAALSNGAFDAVSDATAPIARHARPALTTTYATPRNQLEADVVAVWEAMLGINPIGVLDDFFELGGHSLLGTRLVTRLREKFEVELPLLLLFQKPTVAGITEAIASEYLGRADGDLGAILNEIEQPDRPDYPLLPVEKEVLSR